MDPDFFLWGCYQRTRKVFVPEPSLLFFNPQGRKDAIMREFWKFWVPETLETPDPGSKWGIHYPLRYSPLPPILLSVTTCPATNRPSHSNPRLYQATSAEDKGLSTRSSNRHRWVFQSSHRGSLSTPWNLGSLSSGRKKKAQLVLSVDWSNLVRYCRWIVNVIMKLYSSAWHVIFLPQALFSHVLRTPVIGLKPTLTQYELIS